MAAPETDAGRFLFLSDAHLGGFTPEKDRRIEEDLIALIGYCREQAIKIAVLGDLFDYWMEYPGEAIPQIGGELLDAFEDYNRKTGPTIYITGNHDNWTRTHFRNRGFRVVADEEFLTLNGKKVMLLHGDGLSDDRYSLPRPLLHRLLRHPSFIRFYQQVLPPKAGLTLMKYVSRLTRKIDESFNEEKTLNKWAENELKNTTTDVIICGHDHVPRVRKFDFGTFLNLGTFCHGRTAVLYNNGTFLHVCWEGSMQQFKPIDIQTADNR